MLVYVIVCVLDKIVWGNINEIIVVWFVKTIEDVVGGTNRDKNCTGKLLVWVIAVLLRASWRCFDRMNLFPECDKLSDLSCCYSNFTVMDWSCWTVAEVQVDGLNSMAASNGNTVESMESTVEFLVWWCQVEDCEDIASSCTVSGIVKLCVSSLYDHSAVWCSYSYAYV